MFFWQHSGLKNTNEGGGSASVRRLHDSLCVRSCLFVYNSTPLWQAFQHLILKLLQILVLIIEITSAYSLGTRSHYFGTCNFLMILVLISIEISNCSIVVGILHGMCYSDTVHLWLVIIPVVTSMFSKSTIRNTQL